MFANDLALNPNDSGITGATNAAITFKLTNVDAGASSRIASSSTIGAPHTLSVGHQTSGKGSAVVDRHVVRIDRVFAAAGDVPEQKLSAYLVLVVPRQSVTVTHVIDAVGTIIDLCKETSAFDLLLRGES